MAYRGANVQDYADAFHLSDVSCDQLGFSLKPPDWLVGAAKSAISGAVLAVPTGSGGVTNVKLDDPAAAKEVFAAMLSKNAGAGAPQPPPGINLRLPDVTGVPTWMWAVGAAALLLVAAPVLFGGARRRRA
jgi:hypothetical protein